MRIVELPKITVEKRKKYRHNNLKKISMHMHN